MTRRGSRHRRSAVELTSRTSGRSRLAFTGPDRQICCIVHLRDAARATTGGQPATAAELMTTPLTLAGTTPVLAGVKTMREHRAQLALVTSDTGTTTVGVVALEDLLEEVIGEFDDETDPIPTAARRAGRAHQPAPPTT